MNNPALKEFKMGKKGMEFFKEPLGKTLIQNGRNVRKDPSQKSLAQGKFFKPQ